MRSDGDIEVQVSFHGILPEFMKRYVRSLGVKVQGDALVGDRWKARLRRGKFKVGSMGSIQLTEIEIRFRGDKRAIADFLEKLRLRMMRNAG